MIDQSRQDGPAQSDKNRMFTKRTMGLGVDSPSILSSLLQPSALPRLTGTFDHPSFLTGLKRSLTSLAVK